MDEPTLPTVAELFNFQLALQRGLRIAKILAIEDDLALSGLRVFWPQPTTEDLIVQKLFRPHGG